jgi:hypothetical protein
MFGRVRVASTCLPDFKTGIESNGRPLAKHCRSAGFHEQECDVRSLWVEEKVPVPFVLDVPFVLAPALRASPTLSVHALSGKGHALFACGHSLSRSVHARKVKGQSRKPSGTSLSPLVISLKPLVISLTLCGNALRRCGQCLRVSRASQIASRQVRRRGKHSGGSMGRDSCGG